VTCCVGYDQILTITRISYYIALDRVVLGVSRNVLCPWLWFATVLLSGFANKRIAL